MPDSAELNKETSDPLVVGESLLRQRLQNGFELMENGATISGYLTQAEYQFFLATPPQESWWVKPWYWKDIFKGTNNWFYYPPHWSSQNEGALSALQPLTGLTAIYTEAFCQWLTWFDNQAPGRYRLPTPEEAICYPAEPATLGAWCRVLSKLELDGEPQVAGEVTLVGLSVETDQQIRHKLASLPELPRRIRPPSRLDFLQALLNATVYDRVVAHAHGLAQATGLEFEKCRYLYIDLAYATTYFSIGAENHPYHFYVFQRMLALAAPFDRIYKLVEASRLAEAAAEAQLLQQLPEDAPTYRRARLLYQLIEARRATEKQDIFAVRQAGLCYALDYAAYALLGLQTLEEQAENPVKNSPKMQQQAADLYWAARTLIERQENGFPSWEGLRIVRQVQE